MFKKDMLLIITLWCVNTIGKRFITEKKRKMRISKIGLLFPTNLFVINV